MESDGNENKGMANFNKPNIAEALTNLFIDNWKTR